MRFLQSKVQLVGCFNYSVLCQLYRRSTCQTATHACNGFQVKRLFAKFGIKLEKSGSSSCLSENAAFGKESYASCSKTLIYNQLSVTYQRIVRSPPKEIQTMTMLQISRRSLLLERRFSVRLLLGLLSLNDRGQYVIGFFVFSH